MSVSSYSTESGTQRFSEQLPGKGSKDLVMLTDLFHIIQFSGILLNKAAPEDTSTLPYQEFQKYAIS
jgi:hypothetical protein